MAEWQQRTFIVFVQLPMQPFVVIKESTSVKLVPDAHEGTTTVTLEPVVEPTIVPLPLMVQD
jgi:hypothetical protein